MDIASGALAAIYWFGLETHFVMVISKLYHLDVVIIKYHVNTIEINYKYSDNYM